MKTDQQFTRRLPVLPWLVAALAAGLVAAVPINALARTTPNDSAVDAGEAGSGTKFPTQTALGGHNAFEQLKLYSAAEPASAGEALLDSLRRSASLGTGGYLAEIYEGTDRAGSARAVFAVYEVDPDTGEWRPVSSLDTSAAGGAVAAIELPSGTTLIGYAGAETASSMVEYGGGARVIVTGRAGLFTAPKDLNSEASLRLMERS